MALLLLLASCQFLATNQVNKTHGKPSPVVRLDDNSDAPLWSQTQEILNNRCVVCHACYDAPCQLKLTSIEGIDRGANATPVYDGRRLIAADPTRLFVDAETTEQWRKKGFHPVLNEREQNAETNLQLSLMYQLLVQKREHPLPKQALLPEDLDVSLMRKASCPKIETYQNFKTEHPLMGMPFGLPGLNDSEFKTIEQWIATGGKQPVHAVPTVTVQKQIDFWEQFFNGASMKQQLVNRYLYEHLYLAHLYFSDAADKTQFFTLVRSYTPPGQPIQVIPARRPFDSPYIPRANAQPPLASDEQDFYYRLRAVNSTIVNKTHQPYVLNDKRHAFWQEIFYQPQYKVAKLPSYEVNVASNPFIAFADIPARSRYKFLLEEAQYSIMNFIKGPVCRGQIALDVINDNFWISFINPDSPYLDSLDSFLDENAHLLTFPSNWGNGVHLFAWNELADSSMSFMQKKTEHMDKVINAQSPLTLDIVWDGYQGENDNAALTIMRNFDSATVVKGFAGTEPKTSWLLGYTLLERIHYLLVAGFEVNGNVGHQLVTRLYMEFLRMEGEAAFISLLPKEKQLPVKNTWYVDAGDNVDEHFDVLLKHSVQGKGIPYKSDDVQSELYDLLTAHTHANRYTIEPKDYPGMDVEALMQLHGLVGINVSILPQVSLLRVTGDQGQDYWFTLMNHSAHKNLSHLISEKATRTPEKDELNVLPGIITAYPNGFLSLRSDELDDFYQLVKAVKNEQDYVLLLDRYGVRRTSDKFWSMSDAAHDFFRQDAGIEYGMLDYNRLQNR